VNAFSFDVAGLKCSFHEAFLLILQIRKTRLASTIQMVKHSSIEKMREGTLDYFTGGLSCQELSQ
tara:strand:- start:400 stop:594 length:195 start_codon:yes stop_codon:yes gene_type:complete